MIKYTLIIFFVASWLFASTSDAQSTSDLHRQLLQCINNKKAQIGIAVILNGKDTVTVNNNRQYPMMSVFKFHQALAVAHYLEQNELPLDTELFIAKESLKENTYSPLRDKFPKGNISLPVSELLKYTLHQSDNNACDILFDYTGGPKTTDAYIRSLGISQFAITATEDDMHQDLNTCYRNWTTPLEMVRLLDIFLLESLPSAASHSFLRQTMIECQTGKDRLPAPLLHAQAEIGHKTGTGDRNEKGQVIGINDAGFVFLPNGYRYTIAVFIKDSEESDTENARIIARISDIVFQYASSLSCSH